MSADIKLKRSETSLSTPAGIGATAQRGRDAFNTLMTRFGIVVALILLCAVLAIHSQNVLGYQAFLTPINLIQIALQTAINIIIAVGMTFIITTGGIDLSVGSIVALSGIGIALASKGGAHPLIAMLAGVGIGSACGLVNGLLITRIKLPPFIVTLGTMGIFRGLTLLWSSGQAIYGLPKNFNAFFNSQLTIPLPNEGVINIPTPVIIAFGIALIFGFILNRTRLGEYTTAIGGNEETARLSGVPVDTYKTIVYVLTGALCGVASAILIVRISAAEAIAGQNYELNAIAATVIGGTSLTGGEGTIFGTVIGGLLMTVVQNGMNLFAVQVYWQQIIIGLVIVLAVTLDRLKKQG